MKAYIVPLSLLLVSVVGSSQISFPFFFHGITTWLNSIYLMFCFLLSDLRAILLCQILSSCLCKCAMEPVPRGAPQDSGGPAHAVQLPLPPGWRISLLIHQQYTCLISFISNNDPWEGHFPLHSPCLSSS